MKISIRLVMSIYAMKEVDIVILLTKEPRGRILSMDCFLPANLILLVTKYYEIITTMCEIPINVIDEQDQYLYLCVNERKGKETNCPTR